MLRNIHTESLGPQLILRYDGSSGSGMWGYGLDRAGSG
jgi:hypothetical protein